MNGPTVSVIVVSQGRPDALSLCLTGVSQLLYPNFEIVVVSDWDGLNRLSKVGWDGKIKTSLCKEANISVARNLGLAEATGEIVAFIDDDSVPEPTWLAHLVGPFVNPDVSAAGGYVIGRNGISFQWTARDVLPTGVSNPLEVHGSKPTILTANPTRGIKTEGTNMAFRRDILCDMGGFDPAFYFFLDETDVNMRLAARECLTAIVPLAQVHHGFVQSDRRRVDRVPTTLFEVGASLAVFLRKNTKGLIGINAWATFQIDRRRGLIGHMLAGRIEPRDVRRLMKTLRDGYKAGLGRSLGALPPIPMSKASFLAFRRVRSEVGHVVISGRPRAHKRLAKEAQTAVEAGRIVTLIRLSRTVLYHRVRFHPDGYWEQSGGIFGRSLRTDPLIRLSGFSRRVARESKKLTKLRQIEA